MSDIVWKFELVRWVQAVERGEEPPPSLAGKIVHVGLDGAHQPCVWIRGNPDEVPPRRNFAVAGTGQKIPSEWEHVGTYTDGPFVWHVFEVGDNWKARLT